MNAATEYREVIRNANDAVGALKQALAIAAAMGGALQIPAHCEQITSLDYGG